MKISLGAPLTRDGSKPTVLYIGAQHAREWITPEMVRRLHAPLPRRLRHATARSPTWSTRTELWFVPVANPDGYDYTFTDGQRLWRKNLRDNNGDGAITPATASTSTATSPTSGATTTRAPRPTRRARPTAARRRPPSRRPRRSTRCSSGSGPSSSSTTTRPPSCCSTASAGRWRRPSPDDVIYEAHGRRRRAPRRPGLRPGHLRRALHHQRRHRHAHAGGATARSASRPEMSHLRDGVATPIPDDEWEAEDCAQRLQLPRRRGADPGRVREEHPVRAGGRRVRGGPGRPGVGRRSRPRRTSCPTRSTSPTATRSRSPSPPSASLKQAELHYRINGGRPRRSRVSRVEGRRALRRRERTLLRRVPRQVARRARRRPGRGLVHGRAQGRPPGPRGRERALHLHGQVRHRRQGARARQRGLHGLQPDVPARQ